DARPERRDRPASGLRPPGAARECRQPRDLVGRRRGAGGSRRGRLIPRPPRLDARSRRRLMSHILGIDVSTTATKAVVVDGTGRLRGIGASEYGTDSPHPLWSEQDPESWWSAAVVAIQAALA